MPPRWILDAFLTMEIVVRTDADEATPHLRVIAENFESIRGVCEAIGFDTAGSVRSGHLFCGV